MKVNTCAVEGCARSPRTGRAAYCEMHYTRLLRTGETGPPETIQRQHAGTGLCTISGCTCSARNGSSPYCGVHYGRLRRSGTPEGTGLPRGENHWAWTGDDATYNAAHLRVRAKRGTPSAYQCVDCGNHAYHWSYDRTDPAERISDAGSPYSLDVNRYAPRCTSCHKKFDCAALSQERGGSLSATPRCAKPLRPKGNQELDVCGRPIGHAGQHLGSRAFRRQIEQKAARRELRRRERVA